MAGKRIDPARDVTTNIGYPTHLRPTYNPAPPPENASKILQIASRQPSLSLWVRFPICIPRMEKNRALKNAAKPMM